MLSVKIYQTLLKPALGINILRSYRFTFNSQIIKNSQRFIRFSKQYTSSNVVRLAKYGLAGSLVTYVSCAVWEYENLRSNMSRKSFFKTQFANIFGRSLSSSDVFWVIAGINVTIFALFRFSHNYNELLKNFLLHVKSNPPSLFLSMFTHIEAVHLLINMYVLHSFSSLINYIGAPHFIAVYVTGGIVSSLGSLVYKTMKSTLRPSVGASGCILSILAMFATIKPDLKFGIPLISDIFDFSFSARTAMGGLLIFDLCGLYFFKASRLDHVCHISAVLFGIFYGLIGKRIFWESRKTWMSWYYSLRSN